MKHRVYHVNARAVFCSIYI